MRLSELKQSLTQMERGEALTLILDIRKSRRTSKRKPSSIKKKSIKKKATPMQTLLKGLGGTDIDSLINLIEGQKK